MFVFLFCDNNKDSTLVCSRFVNIYCTICSFWSTKVPVRNRKKKQCIPLSYATGFRWGRTGEADALTDVSETRFQSRISALYSLGLAMVTRITLVLHTLPKGLFAWSSSSHHLTLVFTAMLLPLLAAQMNTAQRAHTNTGWLQAETALGVKGPSAEGARTVHWQM